MCMLFHSSLLPSFFFYCCHIFSATMLPSFSSFLLLPSSSFSTLQLTVMKTRGKPEVSAQSSAEQVNRIIYCLSFKYSMRFICMNCQCFLLSFFIFIYIHFFLLPFYPSFYVCISLLSFNFYVLIFFLFLSFFLLSLLPFIAFLSVTVLSLCRCQQW